MVLLTTFPLAYPAGARAVHRGLAALLQYCLFPFSQGYFSVCRSFFPTRMPYLHNSPFPSTVLTSSPSLSTPSLLQSSSSPPFTPGNCWKYRRLRTESYSLCVNSHQRGPFIPLIQADRWVVLLPVRHEPVRCRVTHWYPTPSIPIAHDSW